MTFLKRYTGVVLAKQDISCYPFEEFLEADLAELDTVAETQKITQYNSWMLPQMLAKFGSWVPVWSGDKIDAGKTVVTNIGEDPKLRGMYLVATKLPRGKLVAKQNSPQGSQYGALVPIVMAALKKYQNISYRSWDPAGIKYVVDKNLAQAMLTEDIPELTQERLLEIRHIGLTTKSGRTEGQQKPVTSTWALTGIADTELGHLPKLAVTMLTQIWLAHPSIRNQYMILDPLDWDRMPEPLVSNEIFTTSAVSEPAQLRVTPKFSHDLPW